MKMYKKANITITFFILIIFFLSPSILFAAGESKKDTKELYAPLNAIYLRLNEACELALRNNFDIQLAKFDARLKEADLDDAISIYDTILEAEFKFEDDQQKSASTTAGSRNRTNDYNLGISKKLSTGTTLSLDFENQRSWTDSGATTVNPAHESVAKLTLEQELGRNFFGIEDRSEIKITKLDIQNAEYTSLDKIEKELAKVQTAYWQVSQDLNIIKIRRNMLKQAKNLFDINKKKVKKGIIEQPQFIASEANLEQKKIDLILARNQLFYSLNKLSLLLNLEDRDKNILPEENLFLLPGKIVLTKTLKVAFDNRRDYVKAKNEIDSKKLKLVMKKNKLFPEINLEASVAKNGLDDHFSQAVDNISAEDNPEYFLGLTLKFPLENREAKSEFNKAKIEKAEAIIDLKKIERKIFVEIKDSVRNCNILAERVKKQKRVIDLQNKKMKAELKKYKYGRSDTDTVIKYQDDLLLSKLLYNQALFDYRKALIDLRLKENSLLGNYWSGRL